MIISIGCRLVNFELSIISYIFYMHIGCHTPIGSSFIAENIFLVYPFVKVLLSFLITMYLPMDCS